MRSINKSRPDFPKPMLIDVLRHKFAQFKVVVQETAFWSISGIDFDINKDEVLTKRFEHSTALTKKHLEKRLKLWNEIKTMFLSYIYEYNWEVLSSNGIFADTMDIVKSINWEINLDCYRGVRLELNTEHKGIKNAFNVTLKDRQVEHLLDQKLVEKMAEYYFDKYKFQPKYLGDTICELFDRTSIHVPGVINFKDQILEYNTYCNGFTLNGERSILHEQAYIALIEINKLGGELVTKGVPVPDCIIERLNTFPKDGSVIKESLYEIEFTPTQDGLEIEFTFIDFSEGLTPEMMDKETTYTVVFGMKLSDRDLNSLICEDVYSV